jgi:hypothetical protein
VRGAFGLAASAALVLGCTFDSTGNGNPAGDAGSASDGASSGSTESSSAGTTGSNGSANTTTPSPTSGDPSGGTENTTVDSSTGAPPPPADWWDPAYAQRIRLGIDETADDVLPVGYSVVLRGYDWATLVTAGELRSDAQDLRIVRHSGGGAEELHRRLIRPGAATSEVWFKTVADIDGSSVEYYAYFDNPDAVSPPQYWSDSMGADAPSEVYLAADSFQEHQAGECPDGWGDCGGIWSVALDGGNRYLLSDSYSEYLLAGDDTWDDVWVEARVASLDPSGCPGIASRALDADTLTYSGFGCDNATVPPDSISIWIRDMGYTPIVWGDAPIAASQWNRVANAWTGDTVRLFYGDELIGSADASAAEPSGRVGIFSTYGTQIWADEVIVRRYVDPEPTVTAMAVEAYGG